MSLVEWYPDGIVGEIRAILRAQQRNDADSLQVCRQWAREFIQGLVPDWTPGMELTWEENCLIGRAFEQVREAVCPGRPRFPILQNRKQRTMRELKERDRVSRLNAALTKLRA